MSSGRREERQERLGEERKREERKKNETSSHKKLRERDSQKTVVGLCRAARCWDLSPHPRIPGVGRRRRRGFVMGPRSRRGPQATLAGIITGPSGPAPPSALNQERTLHLPRPAPPANSALLQGGGSRPWISRQSLFCFGVGCVNRNSCHVAWSRSSRLPDHQWAFPTYAYR